MRNQIDNKVLGELAKSKNNMLSETRSIHQMKLLRSHFEAIEQGIKTVEIRLHDEKRSQISAGDMIEFSCSEDPDRKLLADVVRKTVYADFKELVENYDPRVLGFEGHTPNDICEYLGTFYDEEKQKKYRAAAIEIAVCDGQV